MSKPRLGRIRVGSCLGGLTYIGTFEDSDIPIYLVQIPGGPEKNKGNRLTNPDILSLPYTVLLPPRRDTEKAMEAKPRRGIVPVRISYSLR